MIELENTSQVWLIHGNLGGGKTMSAVALAVNALSRGYYVCSNVSLNLPVLDTVIPWASKLYQKFDVQTDEYDERGNLIKRDNFNPFDLPCGDARGTANPKRVLVIFDECAEWFDQYSNLKSPFVGRVMSWLRHTSKRNQDVIFICQRLEYLQKNFRILCSRFVQVDDLDVWRLPVFKIRIPFMRGFVMARCVDRVGTKTSPISFFKKSFYGRFYNTAQNLSSFGHDSQVYVRPEIGFRFPWLLFLFYIVSCFILIIA